MENDGNNRGESDGRQKEKHTPGGGGPAKMRRRQGREMTDLQLYILVAIPLVGILTNTGLFLHLSSRLDGRIDKLADSIHADLKDLNKAMTALEIDVAMLKDKVGM
jgi:hypothetical protein